MTNNTQLRPFNLADALAGKPVVTRDGRIVEQLTLLDKAAPHKQRLLSVFDNAIHCHYEETGKYWTTSESGADLFMLAQPKTYWFAKNKQFHSNKYKDGLAFDTTCLYESKEYVEQLINGSYHKDNWELLSIKIYE
jgi:hypothetical protein